MPVGRNVFPVKAYTDAKGSITRDIFQPEHPGWFDDRELFIRLQNEAVEEKLAAYQERGLAVEVTHYFISYGYTDGQGVVVVLNDYDFSVEFKEGLVKRPEPELTPSPTTQTAGKVKRENRRRNEWEATTLTRALHIEAAKDFRLCLVLNITALLGIRGFDLKWEEGKAAQPGPANRIVSEELRKDFENDLSRLTEGFEGPGLNVAKNSRGTGEAYPPTFDAYREGVTHIFDALSAMNDEDLQALFSRLTALTISHTNSDTLWNTEVKKLVAEATKLDVAEHFDASDRDYLALHTKADLGELAQSAGVLLDVTTLKKQVAVEYLSAHEKVRAFVPERLKLEAAGTPEDE